MWFEPAEVERLRQVYNSSHPHSKIAAGSPETVWKRLQERFHDECKTGQSSCILASMIQKPRAPESWTLNRYEWLSSDDIAAIEAQYVKLFEGYAFLGCVPIDFDLKDDYGKCIVSTLCSVQIKRLYDEGKHRVGIVFNTDPHDGPGEHWIALYADFRPELEFPQITYFDSYAQKPEKEVQVLMRRWKEQLDALKVHPQPTKLAYNKTRHQYKNSECGMYCIYYHYCCLTNIPMDERIPDDVVNSFRNLLFRLK